MSFTKSLLRTLPLAIIVLGLLGYSYMNATWSSAPVGGPTGNNTPAPINIGIDNQAKLGDLGAVRMRSAEYCNAAGTRCAPIEDLINLLPNTCTVKFDYNYDNGKVTGSVTRSITGFNRFAIGIYARKDDSWPSTPLLSDEVHRRSWDCGWYDWENSCRKAIIGYANPAKYATNPAAYDTSGVSGDTSWIFKSIPLAKTIGAGVTILNRAAEGFGAGRVKLTATVISCKY